MKTENCYGLENIEAQQERPAIQYTERASRNQKVLNIMGNNQKSAVKLIERGKGQCLTENLLTSTVNVK